MAFNTISRSRAESAGLTSVGRGVRHYDRARSLIGGRLTKSSHRLVSVLDGNPTFRFSQQLAGRNLSYVCLSASASISGSISRVNAINGFREIESQIAPEQSLSKERGNKYFTGRLRDDFPAIYADLVAGKIKNVRQACLRAGLIQPVTRDSALIRDFKRATPAERRKFLDWLRTRSGSKTPSSAPIADPSGRLVPAAIVVIKAWLRGERITPGKLLSELGSYSNFDTRLSRALQGDPLPPSMLVDVEVWLRAHGFK